MNAYYDVVLKEFRLNELSRYPALTFIKRNMLINENPNPPAKLGRIG